MYPCHTRVGLQELSHFLSIGTMLLHAQMERLKSQVEDKRVHGGRDGAEVAHELSYELGDITHLAKFLGIGETMVAVVGSTQTWKLIGMSEPVEISTIHDAASHLAGCSIHILGGAMGYDVGTPFEGTAVDRCGKGVVDDKWHSILMGNACKFLDIKYRTSRITDGLAEDYLGVGTESLLYLFFGVVRVDKGAVDTKLLECDTKQIECATIDLVACHNMVACLADIEHCIEVGSLTATCQYGSHSTFELRYLLCHNVVSRVLQTTVEIAFFLQIEEHSHLL